MTRARAAAVASLAVALAAAPVVGAPPAAAPPRSDAHAGAREVELLLDSWRFKEAAAALGALRRVAPEAPETKFADGYHKFLTGDYEGAVRALEAAAAAPA
ncbi:MAG: hypothetical protein ABUR63_02715, partial [Verrucomicrobiota bacterium]